jgi:hypothetical protein
MPSAKDLRVAPIASGPARLFVKRHHYSGKVAANSQLHLGVFWDGRLEGVMQFGPPMDKRHLLGMVPGTPWHGMLELNRMVFTDRLPRNSESRALGVALRLIRREYPQVQWIVSFADACQCGDGTIYRAAGFLLTAMRKNTTLWRMPDGEVVADICFSPGATLKGDSGSACKKLKERGAARLPGFQLRYIYFTDPAARERLAGEILPFSAIAAAGAGMYRGERRAKKQDGGNPPPLGGAIPTRALHSERSR